MDRRYVAVDPVCLGRLLRGRTESQLAEFRAWLEARPRSSSEGLCCGYWELADLFKYVVSLGHEEHVRAVAAWARPSPAAVRAAFDGLLSTWWASKERTLPLLRLLLSSLSGIAKRDLDHLGTILATSLQYNGPEAARFCRALLDNPTLTPREARAILAETRVVYISAWAGPTLEAIARLELRFAWIKAVVAARPKSVCFLLRI